MRGRQTRRRPNALDIPHGERRLAFGPVREVVISVSVALLAFAFVIGLLLAL